MVHIEQRLRRHDTSGSGPVLAPAVGTTVHVYAEQSGYLGRFTVTGATVEGNLIVEGPTGRGKVRPDQCFGSKREAMTAAGRVLSGTSGWAAAAMIGGAGR